MSNPFKKFGSPSDDSAIVPSESADATPVVYHDDGEPFALAAGDSGSLANGSSAPVASIATLGDWLANGFWTNQGALPHHWASNTITYNLGNLTASEQALALSALNAWHEVANITFVQTSGTANITFNHNGTMQAVTSASWDGSGHMLSATVDISSDWIATDGGANDGKTGIDSYGYQTYIHEIGHALGLGHQGPYNGSASYSNNAIFANDTWQYSIMSYFSENNYSGSSYRYVITPQMADIYAVALMYGASTTTRTGNTVYGFHNTAGSIYDFSAYIQAPALTIYDSGGNDTLDCSGYSNSQTIDLHAGSFSSVGGLVHNIGIALGTIIENAIGGSGSDTIIANDLGCTLSGMGGNDTLTGGAGNDRLIGGAGVDLMTGNGGADTFVFASGDSSAASGQHDRITDFTSGDHIDISAIGSFHFLGTSAFDGSTYALDYLYNSTTGITTLFGDINGDKIADFAIDVTGNITFTLADFIGAQPAGAIESFGLTSLTVVSNIYYLYGTGTGSGPSLKYGTTAIAVGSTGTWTPIGAEQTGTGYEVAFKGAGADQYMIWFTDSSGAYLSNVQGTGAAISTYESSFQQDLNGDGTIGPVGSAIESFGSTSLNVIGNTYYLYSISSGTGPSLKFGTSPVTVGATGMWTPIGAEQSAGGYQVAFKVAGTDQYMIWNTDSTGTYLNSFQGNGAAIASYESNFHQDLNGDGLIGLPDSTIESFGATRLVVAGHILSLNPISGGSGTTLKIGSASVPVDSTGIWTPIGAEQTASGYVVAWKVAGADQYMIWTTDSSGAYLNNFQGNGAAITSYESSFQQDLNGDGVIGAGSAIESFGSTSLSVNSGIYYLYDIASGTGPSLKYGATPIAVGTTGIWTPIGAEQTPSGYEVAWKVAGSDQYMIWFTDSNGVYLSNLQGNGAWVASYEASFQQDLNGSGSVGQAPLAQASLAAADAQHFNGFLQDGDQFNFREVDFPAFGSNAAALPGAMVDSVMTPWQGLVNQPMPQGTSFESDVLHMVGQGPLQLDNVNRTVGVSGFDLGANSDLLQWQAGDVAAWWTEVTAHLPPQVESGNALFSMLQTTGQEMEKLASLTHFDLR